VWIVDISANALHICQPTKLAEARANTIRLKLIKIGAVVMVSVRRVKLAPSEACPHPAVFMAAFHALNAAAR
jgi:hypothetical protein